MSSIFHRDAEVVVKELCVIAGQQHCHYKHSSSANIQYYFVKLLPDKHSNNATSKYQLVNLLPGKCMTLTKTWGNSNIVILDAAAK